MEDLYFVIMASALIATLLTMMVYGLFTIVRELYYAIDNIITERIHKRVHRLLKEEGYFD